MPLPEVTKRITLDAVGAPEMWVEFKRVPGMKYRELIEFNNIGKSKIPEEEQVTKRFAMLIVGWNIPDETGEVLPLPSEKPDIALEVPVIFTDYIANEIFRDSEEGGLMSLPLPTESETNSRSSLSPLQEIVEGQSPISS